MTCYASIGDAKLSQNTERADEDDRFLFYVRVVSRRIDKLLASNRPYFAPYIETRKQRVVPTAVNSFENTYTLNTPLLALQSLSIGDTMLTLPSDAVGYPDSDIPPFTALQLTDYYSTWYGDCSGCGVGSTQIAIGGIWGYHSNYAEAWQSVDMLGANITDSATTLTVADVDGDDPYGIAPRISAGNLLKIGDEMMEVASTNIATNVVTVKRGVNGSTAAAHSLNDPVYVWYADEPIRSVTARQAGLLYIRRGAYNTTNPGDGNTAYPPDLLQELLGVLQGYANGT